MTNCSEKELNGLLRHLFRTDLYFLLWYGCARKDIAHPWLFDRCKEIQEAPNGYVDLWSRDHYKSTIITFGKTIQDIIASHGDDPLPEWQDFREPTFGIFSHNRPIAKAFLRQIKVELENNDLLKQIFPDILYDDPKGQAPMWSEDNGLVVKRKSNPKESTLEAHGLVDGQPTSRHFVVRIYDDVVTDKTVTTPDMIKKTNAAWGLSLNLGVEHGFERYVGTPYKYNDTYTEISRHLPVRKYPATDDGTADGKPVFRSEQWIKEKKRAGSYIFACQELIDPKADALMSFNEEDLRFYREPPKNTNNYILCDPANSKKKESDYTSMWVLGAASDGNLYALAFIRDRLGLVERGDLLFKWHEKYRPIIIGYERYGMQADIDYFNDRMEREQYRFDITEVGGQLNNTDRVLRLTPDFEFHKIWLPQKHVQIMRDSTAKDMTRTFIDDEYSAFPGGIHPDMLDSLSRHHDIDIKYPVIKQARPLQRPRLNIA